MRQFNLLEEKWLLVMTKDNSEREEVSLKDLFQNAHKYQRLAGETATQDFAVLRFLLAVLHTVFSRFNHNGENYEYVTVDKATYQVKDDLDEGDISAFKRDLYITWVELWKKKEFPEIVNKYLEKYYHRFNLIDEEYPFFQFPEIGKLDYPYSATENNINKLNGKILEGDPTKPRLFMSVYQSEMDLSVAARWLLYTNGYAPSKSGNPGKKKKRDSTGVAYLGKLGGIYASGGNLFETLLLNLNLIESSSIQKPIWEEDPKIEKFNIIPDNLAQLFTYPSRQLLLRANSNKKITEFVLDLAISNFEYAPNLMLEPFTFWKYDEKLDVKKWGVKEGYIPKRHKPEKYFWQEMQTFSSIEGARDNPGIIEWLRFLQGEEIVEGLIVLNAVGENYIQKDGVVDRQIYDQIAENIGLLDKQENGWLSYIADEIQNTEKVIKNTLLRFAKDIDKIRNLQNNATEIKIKTQIYFNIDRHFRDWLVSISPQDVKKERTLEWKSTLRQEITKEANELQQSVGNREYLGIYNGNNLENIHTAYIRFKNNLNKELGVKK